MQILVLCFVIAAILGLFAGLTRVVITASIWFVLGIVIQSLFGSAIVGFFAAMGITVPFESIPALTAVIGVIHGFISN